MACWRCGKDVVEEELVGHWAGDCRDPWQEVLGEVEGSKEEVVKEENMVVEGSKVQVGEVAMEGSSSSAGQVVEGTRGPMEEFKVEGEVGTKDGQSKGERVVFLVKTEKKKVKINVNPRTRVGKVRKLVAARLEVREVELRVGGRLVGDEERMGEVEEGGRILHAIVTQC